MFEYLKKHAHAFNVITIVIPVITGIVGVILTATQLWTSSSFNGNLPQIRSNTVSEFQAELKERQSDLQSELKSIESLLADLARTGATTKGRPIGQLEEGKDFFLVSGLKTLAIYLLLTFTVAFSILFLVVDLIALLFNYDFPILSTIWEFSWNTATIEWYWEKADVVGVVTGFCMIMLTGVPGLILESRRKKQEREDNL